MYEVNDTSEEGGVASTSTHLAQCLLSEAEGVEGLVVGGLVPPEPLPDAGHVSGEKLLNVPDVVQVLGQRVVHVDADHLARTLCICWVCDECARRHVDVPRREGRRSDGGGERETEREGERDRQTERGRGGGREREGEREREEEERERQREIRLFENEAASQQRLDRTTLSYYRPTCAGSEPESASRMQGLGKAGEHVPNLMFTSRIT